MMMLYKILERKIDVRAIPAGICTTVSYKSGRYQLRL